jgi:CheY-like chemotaxis protein
MSGNEYLSTGEAARMLGLSRSTVARRFDEGALKGKSHPITGERLISARSVQDFLAKHAFASEPDAQPVKLVVLRSVAPDLMMAARDIVSADARLEMEIVARGWEALILCIKKTPHLVVLDCGDSDISCPDLIAAIRKEADGHSLPILCCARDTAPQVAVTWGADLVVTPQDVQAGLLRARMMELLRLPDQSDTAQAPPMQHRRRWPRVSIDLPGTIELYRVATPQEYTSGSTIVDNISQGGAGLSKIRIDSKAIPAESFRLVLKVDHPTLRDWHAHCQVVRLSVNGELSAGVQFVQIPQQCREKVIALERLHSPALP